MTKKLTTWQRLARIAYKYDISTQGYNEIELSKTLKRNRNITPEDKQRVEGIMKEWLRNGNRG